GVQASPPAVQREDLIGGNMQGGSKDQRVRELDLPCSAELRGSACDISRHLRERAEGGQGSFCPLPVAAASAVGSNDRLRERRDRDQQLVVLLRPIDGRPS